MYAQLKPERVADFLVGFHKRLDVSRFYATPNARLDDFPFEGGQFI